MHPKFDPETIGFLVADVARLMRAEFDRRTGETGLSLTPSEARALMNVARAGPVRQSALAERMGVEAMTLSTFLDRLEARGLVSRSTDPNDRRAKLVDVTAAAEPVLEQIVDIGTAVRADMAGGLSATQLDEFRTILKQIRANLVAMRPDCQKAGAGA